MKEIKNEFGLLYYFETEISSEEFKNWINQYINEEDFDKYLKTLKVHNLTEFVILSDLEIDFNNRGKGFGKKLLTEFLDKSQGKSILLIAEAFGDNFVKLESWYQTYGFQTISTTIAGPLMKKD